jgi:polysaccharide export outer membrane protein
MISPRSFIYWSIETTEGQPNRFMTGQSIVGPEGMLELGPYGSVRVAGLTRERAQAAVEKQLGKFLKNPRVSLSLEPLAAASLRSSAAAPDAGASKTQPRPPDWVLLRPTAPESTLASEMHSASVLPVGWQPGQTTQDNATSQSGVRVSQWRSMRRSSETAGEPLVPPGWDVPPPSPLPNGVINAKIEEPQPTPLPLPREVPGQPKAPPKTVDSASPGAHEIVGMGDPYITHGLPVPREGAKVSLPPYVLEPPDILLIETTQGLPDQRIRGQHLVRPDGTVNLGIYGSVSVGGLTIDQAKEVIGRQLSIRIKDFDLRNLNVDVLAYNSKFYYIVTDGGGYGEQVFRVPITGSETVLDGISQIYGLPAVASKKRIWVARRSSDGMSDQVLPVDWNGIVRSGSTATNYQILPGDRIYVDANRWVRFDTKVARFLSPFERMFGFTLLGSETVNSIAGRGTFGGTTR